MRSMAEIEKNLGQEATIRFLEYTLPILEKRQLDLIASLDKKDWKEASFLAHKMKASTYILASENFSEYLHEIEDNHIDLIQTQKFKKEMKTELKKSIQIITDDYLNP